MKHSMHRHGSVKTQERIRGIHESFFFVRLDREDTKPHIEWNTNHYASQDHPSCRGETSEQELYSKKRSGTHSKDEPCIEVQKQIPDVEVPRFGSKDIRPS